MNKTVYNLEKKTTDKLGRTKTTKHVGVYSSIGDIEKAKAIILLTEPNVKFEVHICEHLFFEQRPT